MPNLVNIDLWKRVNNKGAWDDNVIANPKFPKRLVVDNDMLSKQCSMPWDINSKCTIHFGTLKREDTWMMQFSCNNG